MRWFDIFTWFFIGLIVFIVLSMIIYFYRFRLRYKRRMEEIMTEKLKEMEDADNDAPHKELI